MECYWVASVASSGNFIKGIEEQTEYFVFLKFIGNWNAFTILLCVSLWIHFMFRNLVPLNTYIFPLSLWIIGWYTWQLPRVCFYQNRNIIEDQSWKWLLLELGLQACQQQWNCWIKAMRFCSFRFQSSECFHWPLTYIFP